jgi:hypothetical protein
MKIEHRVVYSNNAAALSQFTALPVERLEQMRAESANAEQKIFEDLQTAAGAWDRQAGHSGKRGPREAAGFVGRGGATQRANARVCEGAA